MKINTNDLYTKDRAENLQRKYLQMNSIGLATMSGGHAALGLFYGDLLLAGYFSLFLVFGLVYGLYFKNLSHERYVLLGEFLIVTGVACTQFILPSGAASAILLFPLGVTLMAFSQTLVRGSAVFGVGLFVYFSFSYLGFTSPSESIVPQFLTFLVTLVYCGFVLSFQVNTARESVENAVSNLVATEVGLVNTEEVFRKYQMKLKSLNRELKEQNRLLIETLDAESHANEILQEERANQEELTKAIHRDLRNPLKEIINASEALSGIFKVNPEANSVSSYLGFALDGAKRMKRMLDDLLNYTKCDSEKKEEKVNLNEVLGLIRQDLNNLIVRSGATLEFDHLPTVVGYPTQLYQLFQNLLSNALKFSRPGIAPVVRVYMAEEQGVKSGTRVVVSDNGVGISSNQLSSVFGLFNRAHAEEGYEGSGVGLALCKRIAVSHGAELTVESVYGEGTQFVVSFPHTSVVSSTEIEEERSVLSHKNINSYE